MVQLCFLHHSALAAPHSFWMLRICCCTAISTAIPFGAATGTPEILRFGSLGPQGLVSSGSSGHHQGHLTAPGSCCAGSALCPLASIITSALLCHFWDITSLERMV